MPDMYSRSRPQPVIESSPEVPWRELGTITAQTTQPAATAMSVAAVDALAGVVVWDVPAGAENIMLRFQTSADGNAQTVVVLCAPGTKKYNTSGALIGDDYQYGATLVVTGGTQTGSHSNVYADTITSTDKTFTFTICDSVFPNHITTVTAPTKGMRRLCFYATTLIASTVIYIEGRFY